MSAAGRIEVSCALCGSDASTPHLERDGFQVVRCTGCGLRYVKSRLDEGSLEAEYNDQKASPTPYYLETAPEDRRTFLDRLARLDSRRGIERLPRVGRTGTELPIGARQQPHAAIVDAVTRHLRRVDLQR